MVTTNNVCLDRKTRQVHLPENFPEDDSLLEELYNKAAQKGCEDIRVQARGLD